MWSKNLVVYDLNVTGIDKPNKIEVSFKSVKTDCIVSKKNTKQPMNIELLPLHMFLGLALF